MYICVCVYLSPHITIYDFYIHHRTATVDSYYKTSSMCYSYHAFCLVLGIFYIKSLLSVIFLVRLLSQKHFDISCVAQAYSILEWLGIRFFGLIPAVVLPLILTMVWQSNYFILFKYACILNELTFFLSLWHALLL